MVFTKKIDFPAQKEVGNLGEVLLLTSTNQMEIKVNSIKIWLDNVRVHLLQDKP